MGELADIRLGYPFRGGISEVPGGAVRVIQTRDLSRDGLKPQSDWLTTQMEGRKQPDWLLDQDVLFAARGTHTYAALVTLPPAQTVCSPHLYVIRVRAPQQLLPAFLAWQLNQAPIQRYLRQWAEGSHQLSIRRTVLEGALVRIPPLEQQRTAIKLQRAALAERDALQALITNREMELAMLAEHLLANNYGSHP
ncbi:restriction endonuclease subunit S [Dyella dinghuensis]|uniref:restriction endonuclease subunit S n=1 Tax=Dyella dinghuensis TaxID=1920169 RepID=UPI003CCE4847